MLFLNSEPMIHCMMHRWHGIFFSPSLLFDTHASCVVVCVCSGLSFVGRVGPGIMVVAVSFYSKTINGCCKIRTCSNVYLSDARC